MKKWHVVFVSNHRKRFITAMALAVLFTSTTHAADEITVPLKSSPTFANQSFADTYDPAEGPYGGDNVGPAPTFDTNGTIQAVDEPTGLGAVVEEVLHEGHGTTIVDQSVHAKKFLVRTHHVVQISGNVTIVVDEEFRVENFGKIELLDGAKLSIFVKKDATIQDQAAVNDDTTNPWAVRIVNLGTKAVILQDQSNLCAVMTTPHASLQVQDGSDFYGQFSGDSLFVKNHAGVHICGDKEPPLKLAYD